VIGERRIRRDLKGDGHGIIEVSYRYLYGITEKKHGNLLKIADAPAEIRTEDLPNARLERSF
jgi:hypothetical protein